MRSAEAAGDRDVVQAHAAIAGVLPQEAGSSRHTTKRAGDPVSIMATRHEIYRGTGERPASEVKGGAVHEMQVDGAIDVGLDGQNVAASPPLYGIDHSIVNVWSEG